LRILRRILQSINCLHLWTRISAYMQNKVHICTIKIILSHLRWCKVDAG
jgi:hypothetical protein